MTDPTPALATFVVTQNLETDQSGTIAPIDGGVVSFVPTPQQVLSPLLDTFVELEPVTGTFVNGTLTSSAGTPVQLVDSTDLEVNELLYTVVYKGISPVPPGSFAFAAPGNGATTDLNVVARRPPIPGAA